MSNVLVLPLNYETLKGLDLHEGEEVEFYESKPGIFIIAKKARVSQMLNNEVGPNPGAKPTVKEQKAPGKSDEITEEEITILKKLNECKFELRFPDKVNKELNEKERKVLTSLIRKGYVTIYKGGKYQKTGVYNIPNKIYDKFYELIRKKAEPQVVLTPLEGLEKLGHTIIENENAAKELSTQLEKRIRQGEILGIRGFDGKFYVVTRSHYLINSDKIKDAIRKGDKDTASISRSMQMNEQECRALLKIMNEKGEVIEKRRDVYTLA